LLVSFHEDALDFHLYGTAHAAPRQHGHGRGGCPRGGGSAACRRVRLLSLHIPGAFPSKPVLEFGSVFRPNFSSDASRPELGRRVACGNASRALEATRARLARRAYVERWCSSRHSSFDCRAKRRDTREPAVSFALFRAPHAMGYEFGGWVPVRHTQPATPTHQPPVSHIECVRRRCFS